MKRKSAIGCVARYEMRLLARNRVFLALAALVIVGTPLALYFMQEKFFFWHQVALPCGIPAANAALAGIPLSLLVMFVVGEWAAGERRADTLQALSVRPYGNGPYLIGKAIGLFVPLAVVAVLEALPLLVWHAVTDGLPFKAWYYGFYWAVQTLPALLFFIGLAIWVHTIVRMSFVAFALLFAYFLWDVYGLSEWMSGAWDYLGLALPNVFSEITGHSSLLPYLAQRMGVAGLGIAFVLFAVAWTCRPDHSPRTERGWQGASIMVLVLALGIGACFYVPLLRDRQVRETYRAQCRDLEKKPGIAILSHAITWEQAGNRMAVTDTFRVENKSGVAISEPAFYLNPGLNVESLQCEGVLLPSRQKGLAVKVAVPLAAGAQQTWVVRYSGCIDDRVCDLHISDSLREATAWSNSFLRYGKRTAMVSDDYTFLTPECLWYPIGEVPFRAMPLLARREFSRFRLEVRHTPELCPVSQGQEVGIEEGTLFTNEQPLAGLSLAVGNYFRKALEVDGVLCEIYFFSPNGMFATVVDGSEAGIAEGMRRIFHGMEDTYGRAYPFDRIALVETPASIGASLTASSSGSAMVQPELLFAPENWCRNSEVESMQGTVQHISGHLGGGDGRMAAGVRLVDTVDLEASSLNSMFLRNFREERDEFPPMSFAGHLLGRQWLLQEVKNPWAITPMLTEYTGGIYSDEFPGVDMIVSRPMPDEMQRLRLEGIMVGEPVGYEAVNYLETHSLRKALDDPGAASLLPEMFRRMGSYFRRWMDIRVGKEEYAAFLEDWQQRHLFRASDFKVFAGEVGARWGISLDSLMQAWYNKVGLPTILVQDIRQVAVGDSVFLVFDVWNPSEEEGILTCYVRENAAAYEFEEIESRLIQPGACGQMVVPLELPCIEVLLHTNLSANLPATYSRYFQYGRGVDGDGFDMEQVAFSPPLWQPFDASGFRAVDGEVVVDNEDAGFRIVESKVRHLLGNDEYVGSPDFVKGEIYGWVPSVFSYAYGDKVRSFYAKMVGNGDSRVEWTAQLPEGGEYELYVHYLGLQPRFQRVDSVQYCYTLEQGKLKADIGMLFGKRRGECAVSVRSNDGYEDDFYYEPKDSQADWVPLGCYVLDAGAVTLALYDRGIPNRLIFADAIKWVKR